MSLISCPEHTSPLTIVLAHALILHNPLLILNNPLLQNVLDILHWTELIDLICDDDTITRILIYDHHTTTDLIYHHNTTTDLMYDHHHTTTRILIHDHYTTTLDILQRIPAQMTLSFQKSGTWSLEPGNGFSQLCTTRSFAIQNSCGV